MGDEEDTDDPKAMQFAKMDVPEAYMATNDEELVMKLEQVRLTNKIRYDSFEGDCMHMQNPSEASC